MFHCRNRFSLTPIFYAAQNGHNDVLKVLLKAGADPGVEDTNKAGFCTLIVNFFSLIKPYLHVIVLRYGYPYQHSTKLQCPISLPECSLQTGVCSLRNNNIISISQEMISAQVEKFGLRSQKNCQSKGPFCSLLQTDKKYLSNNLRKTYVNEILPV